MRYSLLITTLSFLAPETTGAGNSWTRLLEQERAVVHIQDYTHAQQISRGESLYSSRACPNPLVKRARLSSPTVACTVTHTTLTIHDYMAQVRGWQRTEIVTAMAHSLVDGLTIAADRTIHYNTTSWLHWTLVITDLPAHCVAVGVPAKIIGSFVDVTEQPSNVMNQMMDTGFSPFQSEGIWRITNNYWKKKICRKVLGLSLKEFRVR